MGPLPRATEDDAAELTLSDFEWFNFDGTKKRRREEGMPKYFNVYNDDELKELVSLKCPQQTAAVDLSDASEKKPVKRKPMKDGPACSYMGTADKLCPYSQWSAHPTFQLIYDLAMGVAS